MITLVFVAMIRYKKLKELNISMFTTKDDWIMILVMVLLPLTNVILCLLIDQDFVKLKNKKSQVYKVYGDLFKFVDFKNLSKLVVMLFCNRNLIKNACLSYVIIYMNDHSSLQLIGLYFIILFDAMFFFGYMPFGKGT